MNDTRNWFERNWLTLILLIIIIILVVLVLRNGACSAGNPTVSAPAPTIVLPTATATQVPPTVTVTATVTPTTVVSTTTAITATASCREGVVPGNQANFVGEKVPIGTAEGPTIIEVSWKPGNGYGGYNRAVIVLDQRDLGRNYVILGPATVRMNQYCGALDDVKAYGKDPAHHVRAMIDSSSDANGRPKEDEIPVYFLGKDGILVTLKTAKLAPEMPWYQARFAVYYQP